MGSIAYLQHQLPCLLQLCGARLGVGAQLLSCSAASDAGQLDTAYHGWSWEPGGSTCTQQYAPLEDQGLPAGVGAKWKSVHCHRKSRQRSCDL